MSNIEKKDRLTIKRTIIMDQSIKQILSQCSISTKMTALTFFPDRFYMPFAEEVHGKMFDLIDGPDQKVAIAAPRGLRPTF